MAEKLGSLLVRKRLIDQRQLDEALRAQMIYGGRLGTNLIELDHLNIETLGNALSEQRGFPLAAESEFLSVPAPVVALLTPQVAQKHQAFPLRLDGRRLRIAMCSPYDPGQLDALAFAISYRLVPALVPELRLMFYLERYYRIARSERFIRLAPERSKLGLPAAAQREEPPPVVSSGIPPSSRELFGALGSTQYLSDDDADQDAPQVRQPPLPVSQPKDPRASAPAAPPRLSPPSAPGLQARSPTTGADPVRAPPPLLSPTQATPGVAPSAAPPQPAGQARQAQSNARAQAVTAAQAEARDRALAAAAAPGATEEQRLRALISAEAALVRQPAAAPPARREPVAAAPSTLTLSSNWEHIPIATEVDPRAIELKDTESPEAERLDLIHPWEFVAWNRGPANPPEEDSETLELDRSGFEPKAPETEEPPDESWFDPPITEAEAAQSKGVDADAQASAPIVIAPSPSVPTWRVQPPEEANWFTEAARSRAPASSEPALDVTAGATSNAPTASVGAADTVPSEPPVSVDSAAAPIFVDATGPAVSADGTARSASESPVAIEVLAPAPGDSAVSIDAAASTSSASPVSVDAAVPASSEAPVLVEAATAAQNDAPASVAASPTDSLVSAEVTAQVASESRGFVDENAAVSNSPRSVDAVAPDPSDVPGAAEATTPASSESPALAPAPRESLVSTDALAPGPSDSPVSTDAATTAPSAALVSLDPAAAPVSGDTAPPVLSDSPVAVEGPAPAPSDPPVAFGETAAANRVDAPVRPPVPAAVPASAEATTALGTAPLTDLVGPNEAARGAPLEPTGPALRQWVEEVGQATRMEAVGALLIAFCEERSCRALLFVDYFGTTMAWRGSGTPDAKAALAARVDFAAPSLFSSAAQARKEAVFVPPGTTADQRFFAALPELPAGAMVIPIFAPRQQRLVLYVDAYQRSLANAGLGELLALCAAAALAYARITALSD